MKEFKGSNNAKIVINSATFGERIKIKNALEKELLKQKIELNGNLEKGLSKIIKGSTTSLVNAFKDVLLSCDTSEEFNTVLFACLAHCTYNSIRINEQLFDDVPEAVEDYYLIIKEVIAVNVFPFFKGLLSKSKMFNQTVAELNQK